MLPVSSALEALRAEHYNACVTHVRPVQPGLRILRVQGDHPFRFVPGQYAMLGLLDAEPSLEAIGYAAHAPRPAGQQDRPPHVIKRAYSISARMLDDLGRLVRATDEPWLEFYVTLVPESPSHPPGLTPRLFVLRPGDRLLLGPHAHGHYTLQPVGSQDDVVFCATGAGEAPHNAMLTELLVRGHCGRIASLTSVRYRADLAYLETHRALEQRYANYRYLPLTTREPANLDPAAPGFVGKQYLQEWIAAGGLEREAGIRPSPERTQVYLCGSPQMIGLPRRAAGGSAQFPHPPGMVETLAALGLELDAPGRPGRVHVEQYWATADSAAEAPPARA